MVHGDVELREGRGARGWGAARGRRAPVPLPPLAPPPPPAPHLDRHRGVARGVDRQAGHGVRREEVGWGEGRGRAARGRIARRARGARPGPAPARTPPRRHHTATTTPASPLTKLAHEEERHDRDRGERHRPARGRPRGKVFRHLGEEIQRAQGQGAGRFAAGRRRRADRVRAGATAAPVGRRRVRLDGDGGAAIVRGAAGGGALAVHGGGGAGSE